MVQKLNGLRKTLSEAPLHLQWGFTLPEHSQSTLLSETAPLAWSGHIPSKFWCLGCCNYGKLCFFPITHCPWAFSWHSPPLNPSGRMPIHGNLLFSWSHGFPGLLVSLPINYFWEDAHLWQMLPSAPSPSGYLPQLPCNQSLIYVLYVCTYL